MANEIVELKRTEHGLIPAYGSVPTFDKYKQKLHIGASLFLKIITPKKARALKHHNRYHAVILPTMGQNMLSVEGFVTADSDGVNYSKLHRYFLLKFAHNTGHLELVKMKLTFYNGQWLEMPYVSESFDTMSQKTFEEFEKWLDMIYTEETGVSLLETINQTA
jgi:hypothetical protein